MNNPSEPTEDGGAHTDKAERAFDGIDVFPIGNVDILGQLMTSPDQMVDVTDAQLDAMASDICRLLLVEQEDLKRFEDALDVELDAIRNRYIALLRPVQERIAILQAYGEELARRADFGVKRKSRNVGFGSYGIRKHPENAKVVDNAVAQESLKKIGRGDLIVESTSYNVNSKEAKPVVLELYKKDGVVLDGFEYVEEVQRPFIKPEAPSK